MTFFQFSQKAPIQFLCFNVFYNHKSVLFKAKKDSFFELVIFFQTRSSPVCQITQHAASLEE